jgi:hypothetical protein
MLWQLPQQRRQLRDVSAASSNQHGQQQATLPSRITAQLLALETQTENLYLQ